MRLTLSGHSAAVTRGHVLLPRPLPLPDVTGGIAYYQFLEDLARNFEEKKEEIA